MHFKGVLQSQWQSMFTKGVLQVFRKICFKLFVAIGDGFKKVMCLGDQNRTYQRPYQTFLMMCLDGQICV